MPSSYGSTMSPETRSPTGRGWPLRNTVALSDEMRRIAASARH